ncbi:MAG: hypothetical protein HZB26_22170 [Candidatus Hydrogenedentes bacterium]|nr:hypothetical protein [Candidatus Hydrogenedentota bacterium]
MTLDDFDAKSMEFTGNVWKLTKYVKTDPKSGGDYCFVRFEADGKVLHDFRCGPVKNSANADMDWTRVYQFKAEGKWPSLLAVLWYEGGAHSAHVLRLIKLADSYPVIFDTNETSFRYFEDLDNDGMAEIVVDSFAFDYFYESAIHFSHADSPYGTLVAKYTDRWTRYMWANNLFPDLLRVREDEGKEDFLRKWPGGEKIPVSIATEQYSDAAYAYRALVRWAVHAAYAEGEQKADAIIEQYTDPVLAVFAKHEFKLTLRGDQNYSNMLNNPVKR